jgi:hypothetical protein
MPLQETHDNRYNITPKASLCYGSENWITNKTDALKLEAAQMRFLRPLLGLTRLYGRGAGVAQAV